MGSFSARRFGALVTAAAGVFAVCTAAPAHADAVPIMVSPDAQDSTIAVSGPGKDATTSVQVMDNSVDTVTATNVTLSFDLSPLAGVVDATVSDPRCSTAGTSITCDLGSVTLTDWGSDTVQIPLHLRAAAGATAGESAQYTLTASADGVDPVSSWQPTTVTLADGPDLTGSGWDTDGTNGFQAVTLGSTVSTPKFTAENLGSQDAEGITVVFVTPYEFPFVNLASNCEYARNPNQYLSVSFASCYFDDVIQPGDAYTVQNPQRFTVRRDTISQFGSYVSAQILPGYQPGSAYNSSVTWFHGTQAKLVLAHTGGADAPAKAVGQTPQTGIDAQDGWLAQRYRAANGVSSDLAAVGTRAKAGTDGTVTVTVGIRNYGPGTLDFGPVGSPAGVLRFTAPSGATVTTVPDGCWFPYESTDYQCSTTGTFKTHTTQYFTFTLSVPSTGVTGPGAVVVYHGGEGPVPTGADVYDTVWSNDTATVIVKS